MAQEEKIKSRLDLGCDYKSLLENFKFESGESDWRNYLEYFQKKSF